VLTLLSSLMRAVCETSVALVVRKGNPKNVRTWEDLLQPGLQVGCVVLFMVSVPGGAGCWYGSRDHSYGSLIGWLAGVIRLCAKCA
jgi:accessory colonization factor AcfC